MGLKCTKNWLCGSYCHEKFGFVVSQKPSLADGSPSARWAFYQVYCLLAEVQSAEKEAVAVETAAEAMDGAAAHVNEPLDGTSKMPGRHFEDGSSLDAHGAVLDGTSKMGLPLTRTAQWSDILPGGASDAVFA